ncbi:hypothetical protein BDP27DRAFT_1337696 [Rhodocollybia butyracea]|uniref:Uncharacterized protein n=1 Tax=Rhodocollybia butyracea TaxID=206335 RepID=A0A9P5U0E0_9AGAR|nr:hypothetical protein BDP27DRAFT_1337696 [Rhodocollybia butyracea]
MSYGPVRPADDSHQGFLDEERFSDSEYDPYRPEVERTADSDLKHHSTSPSGSGSNWFSILAIVGGLLAGIIVMICNHIFFAFLDGRRSDLYSQFWITTAKNIVPQVAHVALGVSMSCSLTHAVWYHVGRRSHTLPELDRFVTFSRQVFFTLPLIVIAVINLSLALIGVLVPGALTIESGTITSTIGPVPSVDLSSMYPVSVANMNAASDYMAPSTLFKQAIYVAATTDVAPGWAAPEGECVSALSCSYTFNYTAPALRCTDLSPEDIGNGTDPGDGTTVLINLDNWEWLDVQNFVGTYNATSNLNRTGDVPWNVWEDTSIYDLTIACNPHFGVYNPLALQDSELTPVGSTCTFWNATYSATTAFVNNTQSTSSQILSYNSPLSPSNCSIDACPSNWVEVIPIVSPDANFAMASRAMAETFVDLFLGNLTYFVQTATFFDAGETTSAQYTPLFSVNSSAASWSFDLTAPSGNLSRGLTDLFTNATLAFISIASNLTYPSSPAPTTLAKMEILPSYNQYHYIVWKLWLIYGLAVLAVSIAAVYGIWCMRVDVHPSSMDFSEMVAATGQMDVDFALIKNEGAWRFQYCGENKAMDAFGEKNNTILRKVFRAPN